MWFAQAAIARVAPLLHKTPNAILLRGRFRVVRVTEVSDYDARLFSQPLALAKLGQFLVDMYRVRQYHVLAIMDGLLISVGAGGFHEKEEVPLGHVRTTRQ